MKITGIETKPYLDNMNANIGGATVTTLRINPSGEVEVYQRMNDNATHADVWHVRVIETCIPSHPFENDMLEFLEGNANLIDTIIAGHTIEHDGRNMVGCLTDAAQTALANLESAIDEEFSQSDSGYSFWQLDDWCNEITITGDETDDEIERMAHDAQEIADDEHAIIDGDIREYLLSKRNEHADDILSTADAAEILGVTESGIRRMIMSGRIKSQRIGSRVLIIRRADLAGIKRSNAGRPRKS